MGVMKTLYTAMVDPENALHESEELDHVRCQAWHDAIAGMYLPDTYSGEQRRAYDVGRQQIEETCHEEGINLFEPMKVRPRIEDLVESPVVEETIQEEILSDARWAAAFEGFEDD